MRSDAVIIGAGHNGLATAIILAEAGWRVTVLERAAQPGGAVRTGEVTVPGFRHDLYAANLSGFATGEFFAEHQSQLERHGFRTAISSKPFASAFPGGGWTGVSMNQAESLASIAAHSGADVEAWRKLAEWFRRVVPTLFVILDAPMPAHALGKALWEQRRVIRAEWRELARLALLSSRELVEEHFVSPEVQALVASWAMHLDFSPDLPGGGIYALFESFMAENEGMALGAGGAGSLIDALVALLEQHGGRLVTGAEATRIRVCDGRTTAVMTRDGQEFAATRAVVANTSPRALIRMLDVSLPPTYQRGAERFQYGPGTLMIHLAVDERPHWSAGQHLGEYAYVHVAPYLGDLSIAYAQACAGLLPQQPMIVVGQPTTIDSSRAPVGKHVLWLQVRAVPSSIAGDAGGEIAARNWAEAKEPYADRVLAILEQYAPGLRRSVLGRHVISPTDLERENPNLVGGDHLGGSHHPAQHFVSRLAPGIGRYATPVEGLYMCGAATWPGGGVGAVSGHQLGNELVRRARRHIRWRTRANPPLRAR